MATPDHVRIRAMTSSQAIGELKVKMTSSKNVFWLGRAGGTASLLFAWLLIGEECWESKRWKAVGRHYKSKKGHSKDKCGLFTYSASSSLAKLDNLEPITEGPTQPILGCFLTWLVGSICSWFVLACVKPNSRTKQVGWLWAHFHLHVSTISKAKSSAGSTVRMN